MEQSIATAQTLVEKAEAYVRHLFEREVPAEYKYHEIEHTMRVVRKVKELAEKSDASEEDQEVLALAALFHDSGFSRSYDNHEEDSKAIATSFLRAEGYPEEKISKVVDCIDATKMTRSPVNKLEMLIKDADTSSLGSRNFFEYTDYLREEINTVKGEHIDEMGWNYINLQFMKDHKFYTEAARERFGPMKKQNRKQIESQLGLRKVKGKDKHRSTISSNKSAQTQFKTALRNHIDLSAIADAKANTMLSVASLILSLTLPFIGTKVPENPLLLVPTVILLIVCVVSISYATLAIRPISTRGVTTMDDINKKKSNLFFFGNFHRMKYGEYEDGIKYVVANSEFLDSSITRDLFFLGVALGRKYMFLRRCYNVFMFGLIISVIAFVVALTIGSGTMTYDMTTG